MNNEARYRCATAPESLQAGFKGFEHLQLN